MITSTTSRAGKPFSGVYDDLTGKPVIPAAALARDQSIANRSLNSAFQISATRDALVSYSVKITATSTISSAQEGDVILEIATDSAFTTGVQTVAIISNGQTISLALTLNSVQPITSILSGIIPAGYYARLRTVNVTGSPAFAYRAGQEVFL